MAASPRPLMMRQVVVAVAQCRAHNPRHHPKQGSQGSAEVLGAPSWQRLPTPEGL